MDSLEMLLEMLADYDGTLFVVSHDRDFLERLVTRSLVFANNKIIDLYGGYEDYIKFTQKDTTKPEKEKKAIAAPPALTEPKKSSKLSYKYQRMLEVLPGEIEELEKKIAKLESEIGTTNLYTKDPEKFNLLSKNMTQALSDLDEKMDMWLKIETMRDELE
jgi:ATP-binding cassette subfamily F protein uup